MKFLDFLSNLNNPEKTRNFNQFSNYSLDPFSNCISYVFSKYFSHLNSTNHKITVVGTNGKGSLGYYLQSHLVSSGNLTGFYSSPHLISPLERIMIQGKSISEDKLDSILRTFNREDMEYLKQFSYFEIFTLFAMISFLNEKIEWQIYEAGLGGRLDATKLVESEYIALTKIGLDHTEILGNSLELILQEKLGIVSTNTKCIFALEPDSKTQTNLIEIIENFCKTRDIKLHFFRDISQEKDYLENYRSMSEWMIEIIHRDYINKPVPIKDKNFISSKPPGRLEIIHSEPTVLFDTAHNADAVKNVINTINRTHPNTKWNVFVACLPDKDLNSILGNLISSRNIKNIHTLTFPPFQTKVELKIRNPELPKSELTGKNTYQKNKIETEEDFSKSIGFYFDKKEPILVLGSFRIYSKLKNILY